MKRWRAIGLLMVVLGLACSRGGAPATDTPVAEAAPADSIAVEADSLLRTLTLEEKVGQLFMPAAFTASDPATVRRLTQYVADARIGGIVFLKGDTASMHSLTSRLDRISRMPLIYAIDAEWGLGMRLADAESFPHNSRLQGASTEQMYDYGRRVGLDARRLGLNMVLGPVLDVAPSRNSVMYDRSFGADPERVASLGTAYSRGLESTGVMSVAKHFPGHGATRTDSHKALPVLSASADELKRTDLLPFREYIRSGRNDGAGSGIMVGHVAVPALTGDNVPASVSPVLLSGLLRKEMGFDGLVMTDAMNMDALSGSDSRYVQCLLAGADIILVPADTRAAEREVMKAVRSGVLSREKLDSICRRILVHKLRSRRHEQQ